MTVKRPSPSPSICNIFALSSTSSEFSTRRKAPNPSPPLIPNPSCLFYSTFPCAQHCLRRVGGGLISRVCFGCCIGGAYGCSRLLVGSPRSPIPAKSLSLVFSHVARLVRTRRRYGKNEQQEGHPEKTRAKEQTNLPRNKICTRTIDKHWQRIRGRWHTDASDTRQIHARFTPISRQK